jgi:hypothetical protein
MLKSEPMATENTEGTEVKDVRFSCHAGLAPASRASTEAVKFLIYRQDV